MVTTTVESLTEPMDAIMPYSMSAKPSPFPIRKPAEQRNSLKGRLDSALVLRYKQQKKTLLQVSECTSTSITVKQHSEHFMLFSCVRFLILLCVRSTWNLCMNKTAKRVKTTTATFFWHRHGTNHHQIHLQLRIQPNWDTELFHTLREFRRRLIIILTTSLAQWNES